MYVVHVRGYKVISKHQPPPAHLVVGSHRTLHLSLRGFFLNLTVKKNIQNWSTFAEVIVKK